MLVDAMLPVVLTVVPIVGAGLIAHGRTGARIDATEKALEAKASKEVVERVELHLARIEDKLDRALTRPDAA